MTDTESVETLSASIQLGQQFQLAREKRNLAIGDVAAELKVLGSAVKGIESGDYSAIKGSVFVKGYIKAYANFLQLDIDACMALYAESIAEAQEVAPTALIANASKNANLVKITIIAIVAVILIGLVYLLLSSGDDNEPTLSNSDNLAPAVSETTKPMTEKPPELIFDDLPVTASVILPAEPELNDEVTTDSAPEHYTLSLVFSADCWVEVNDANGQKLISDLKRDGEHVDLNGQPPYEVLLGYGPAVAVSYQGVPVSFEVGRNPTVKLSIGDKQ